MSSRYLPALVQLYHLPVAANAVQEALSRTPATDGAGAQLARAPVFSRTHKHTVRRLHLFANILTVTFLRFNFNFSMQEPHNSPPLSIFF